jgi:CheY-like chemotaxis protein
MHASRQSSPKRREFRSAMMRRGSRVALLVGAAQGLIIALTAHALAEDKARALESGMDDYVTNPVDYASLQRAVAHCCGGRPARATI